MLPLIVRPALLELTGAQPGISRVPDVGRPAVLHSGVRRRNLRPVGGYLTDRFGRRRVLTYSILIYADRRVPRRLLDLGRDAAGAALLRVHRRLRRVRGRRGVARRAVPRAEAPREGARLHAGVLVARRIAGRDRERLVRSRWPRRCRRSRASAAHRQSPRAVALHADVRRDPGDPAHPDPAVPAGIADLAGEAAAGTLKRPSIAALFAPELRRTTIVTTIMFAMAYGAAFGAIQQVPQIVPGLARGAGDDRRAGRPPRPGRSSSVWRPT